MSAVARVVLVAVAVAVVANAKPAATVPAAPVRVPVTAPTRAAVAPAGVPVPGRAAVAPVVPDHAPVPVSGNWRGTDLPGEWGYECDDWGRPSKVWPDVPAVRREAVDGCELPPGWPTPAPRK